MPSKFIIWLQLLSALMLLADAYMSERTIKFYNKFLRLKCLRFSKNYRSDHLKRDLGNLIILVASWASMIGVVTIWQSSSKNIQEIDNFVIFITVSGVVLNVWLMLRMCYQVRYLGRFILLIFFMPSVWLFKAPKGPIYTIGFGLLVVSHVLQLIIER